jgi:hypothetical protein
VTDQKRKVLMAYISVSKMCLEGSFLKRKFLFRKEFPKKEILMAYISNSKMLLEKLPKKEIS